MEDSRTLSHADGEVTITDRADGSREARVRVFDPGQAVAKPSCVTRYPDNLIAHVLEVHGPAWLCNEIGRDEDPTYLPDILSRSMLAFVDAEELRGKRLLDFGCGSGASTVVLARMFPGAEIVGIDLKDETLDLARARARYYGFSNVTFFRSPSSDDLPDDLGTFDFISFSAVFEHMLPAERRELMPKIWALLNPGGVLFANQTPNRLFPLESHTTGLPLLNYLPDRLAFPVARRFSRRTGPDETWESLLRRGVRGGTDREILCSLRAGNGYRPELIPPRPFPPGASVSIATRAKRAVYGAVGAVLRTGFGPWVRIAVRKVPA